VPWASSSGSTLQSLILATHPRRRAGRELDRDPVIPPPVLAAPNSLEAPWSSWRRELTREEEQATHWHAFDQNAQYLAAWQVVELGHGVPILTPRPRFDKRQVGVWRIPPADLPANPASLLPPAWLEREWFTTPTVARMLEVCDGFGAPLISEAWIWPTHSRFLRSTSERLRDARAAAAAEIAASRAALELAVRDDNEAAAALDRLTVAEATLEAVKDMYARGTGRFGWAREEGSPWQRPDWGNLIRAQARVNLHRTLEDLGRAPFAIATDALLFASSEPDPMAFAEQIRLRVEPKIGKFKHLVTIEAPRLDDAGVTAPRLFRMISEEAA
jgi:hypothetical protein